MKKKLIGLMCMALPLVACANRGNNASEGMNEMAAQAEEAAEAVEAADNVLSLEEALNTLKGFKVVDNVIISENLPVVVDFYADWCGPCRMYKPTFHAVADQYKGQAIFVSINTDNYSDIAKQYQVSAIPTTAFIMTGGSLLGVEVGTLEEDQLQTKVNQLIATSAGEDMGL